MSSRGVPGPLALTRRAPLTTPFAAKVVAIYRHVIDANFERRTGISYADRGPEAYLYDVVLTHRTMDRNRLRCMLHPKLNREVRRGALMPGSVVFVSDHIVVTDELARKDTAFAVITELQFETDRLCDGAGWHDLDASVDLGVPARFAQRAEWEPLIGGRSYYMHMWAADIDARINPQWTRGSALLPPPAGVLPKLEDLNNHRDIAQCVGANQGGDLVGWLAWRSRRFHYGKQGDSNRMPLRLEFGLADRSREIKIVVWGEAAAALYPLLVAGAQGAGTVLKVSGYRVRSRMGVLECHVNSRNPAGSVTRLDTRAALARLAPLRRSTGAAPAAGGAALEALKDGDAEASFDTEESSESEKSERGAARVPNALAAAPCLAPEDLLSIESIPDREEGDLDRDDEPALGGAGAAAQSSSSTVVALAQWRRGGEGEEARRRSTVDVYGLIAWAGPVERERSRYGWPTAAIEEEGAAGGGGGFAGAAAGAAPAPVDRDRRGRAGEAAGAAPAPVDREGFIELSLFRWVLLRDGSSGPLEVALKLYVVLVHALTYARTMIKRRLGGARSVSRSIAHPPLPALLHSLFPSRVFSATPTRSTMTSRAFPPARSVLLFFCVFALFFSLLIYFLLTSPFDPQVVVCSRVDIHSHVDDSFSPRSVWLSTTDASTLSIIDEAFVDGGGSGDGDDAARLTLSERIQGDHLTRMVQWWSYEKKRGAALVVSVRRDDAADLNTSRAATYGGKSVPMWGGETCLVERGERAFSRAAVRWQSMLSVPSTLDAFAEFHQLGDIEQIMVRDLVMRATSLIWYSFVCSSILLFAHSFFLSTRSTRATSRRGAIASTCTSRRRSSSPRSLRTSSSPSPARARTTTKAARCIHCGRSTPRVIRRPMARRRRPRRRRRKAEARATRFSESGG